MIKGGQAEGVLVVDKPAKLTSHDIVNQLRRVYRTRRVGHAGTLDPMATGVLVILFGEATKLSSVLTTQTKEYQTTIELGSETDTLDADGRVVARKAVPEFSEGIVQALLAAERERTLQLPPAVSAIKVDGERAYVRARRGEEPALLPRDVRVKSLDLLGLTPTSVSLRLVVSKGYYVRALARDLAQALGTLGHLSMLRRLASGCFDLPMAASLPLAQPLPLLPLAAAAALSLPTTEVTEETARRAAWGQPLQLEELPGLSSSTTGPVALVRHGQLIALAAIHPESNHFKVLRGFVPPPTDPS
jgi:tRNA pseudouridine55 synthase